MAYIGKPPVTQGKDAGPSVKLDDISSNFNGSTKVFDLAVNGTSVTPHVNNVQIYLSGVHQQPGVAYTLSGSQVVFTGAPSSSLSFHGALIGDSRLFIPQSDTIEPTAFTDNARATISGSFSQTHLSSKISGIISGAAQLPSGIVSASVLSSTAQGTIRLATNGVNTDVDSGLQTSDNVQFASVQSDGGVTVDNITIDGTEIDLSSGDLTVDVAGDIVLDADGADVILKDDGTEFGRFKRDSSDFVIKSATNNKDIIFKGQDGGATITALTLDMSEAGNAIFNNDVTIAGTLTAQEIHTEFTSASIMFSSGSTKFGDTIDDTHEVTGSMTMSGSVTVNDGNLVVLDSLGIGTNSPTFAKLDINAPTATNADNLDQSVDRATLRVRYRTDETDDGMFFGGLGSNHGYIQGVADASNDNTSQAGKNIVINPYGGNVGVGTQTMDGFFSVNSGAQNAALHVESTDSNANISMADNAGSVVIAAAGNEFIVETGGSASTAGSGAGEAFRIDDQGLVGIGTNDPKGGGLHIHRDSYPQLIIDGEDNNDNVGFVLSGSASRGGLRWNASNNNVEILREDGTAEILITYNAGTNFANDITIPEKIIHSGDTDTFIRFTDNQINFSAGNATPVVFTSNQLQATFGSNSTPSYTFNGDANTGMYRDSADTLGFATAGAQALKVNGSGVVFGEGDLVNAQFEMRKVNDGGGVNLAITNQAGGVSSSTNETTSVMFFHGQAGTTALGAQIVEMGRVLVGRESTNENDAATDGFMAFHTTQNNTMGEKVRIHSNGMLTMSNSIGINVTDPDSYIEIKADGVNSQGFLRMRNSNDTQQFEFLNDSSGVPIFRIGNAAGSTKIEWTVNGSSISFPGDTTALTIDTSQNGARTLDLVHTEGSVDNQDEIMRCRFSGTNSPTGGRFIAFEDSGGRMGDIGAANSTQVSYTVGSSDRNKKKNFEDWNESVLDELNKANPQMFHFKKQEDSEEKNKGYIAQDLKDAFPEAYPLSRVKEGDEWKDYYFFNPSGMVVYLMKAVQELSKENDDLKKRMEALESN